MKAARFVIATLCVLTAACGGDSNNSTAPARVNIAGMWAGSFAEAGGPFTTLTLTIVETNGAVTASGGLTVQNSTGQPVTLALSGTGAYAPPDLALTLTPPGLQATEFVATVSGTAISGTLNGSGYVNQPISLVRQ